MQRRKDLERQPMLVVTCGETGVGKTYRNLIEIYRYMKDDPETGRKGRKVIAFDVNDDDYPMFRTVKVDAIQHLESIDARRIRPISSQGKNMTLEEKRKVVEQMVSRFKNGLLVLEDIDKFMVGAKGQTVVGLLTTNRHNGLDIMISHQSIAKITTTEWQNMTFLRLHHQIDDISRYKNRIPNYFLVCIAKNIIDEQYDLANEAYHLDQLSEIEYKKHKSFYLYVDMRKLRIRGASKKSFIRAAKKYIDTHESKTINMMLMEKALNGMPKYHNRAEAVVALIMKYLRHLESKTNSAF